MEAILNNSKIQLINFYKRYKYSMLSCIVVSLACYLFCFTNIIPNHDYITAFFNVKGPSIALGRWGLELLKLISPSLAVPLFWGILEIIVMAFTCALICKICCIGNKAAQILLSGIVASFPSLITANSYCMGFAYSLSIILAVLCVYFALKKPIYYCFSILSLVFSLSIYQSQISITISLIFVLLIKTLIYDNAKTKAVLKIMLKYFLIIVASSIIYLALTFLSLKISGLQLSNYAETAVNGNFNLISKVIHMYFVYFTMLFSNAYLLIPYKFLTYINCVLYLITVICGFMFISSNKNFKNTILFIILALLFPLAQTCIMLVVADKNIYANVLYSFCLMYFLMYIVINKQRKHKFGNLFTGVFKIACICIIVSTIYFSNSLFTKQYICYQNTFSQLTSISTQIKELPTFKIDKPIAIVGKHTSFPAMANFNIKYSTGFDDSLIGDPSQYPIAYSFMTTFLGDAYKYVSYDQLKEISSRSEVSSMPVYPNYGYIKDFEDMIVVKLSQ